MRKASLGTIFLTIFLDLLGFGLVVPYLPGVARAWGASDFVAVLLGAVFSLAQLVFVPLWGQRSDRVGRRPILLGSIAASAVGMLLLGSVTSLWMLFVARLWNGIATSNIAVAQAYIADVTRPEERAKGMGLIGAGIGLGFIFGPVVGGLLESVSPLERVGAMPAYAAAALSAVNFALAYFYLPESLPEEKRGKVVRSASPFDVARFRDAMATPGVRTALLVAFVVGVSFAGLEQTFRLYTEDAFGLQGPEMGYLLGFSGMIMVLVQGLLLRRLAPLTSERSLIVGGLVIEAVGFALIASSPDFGSYALGSLWLSMGVIALGSALVNPSISAYVSRSTASDRQGSVLGVLQSTGALARVCGPATSGLLYQYGSPRAPYVAAAAGMAIAGSFALRLAKTSPAKSA
jgi:DHA1 family tetracycline resistance protein-like MFS transporter